MYSPSTLLSRVTTQMCCNIIFRKLSLFVPLSLELEKEPHITGIVVILSVPAVSHINVGGGLAPLHLQDNRRL